MNEANLPTKLGFNPLSSTGSTASGLWSNGGQYKITVTPTSGYGSTLSFLNGASTVSALSFYFTITNPACLNVGASLVTTAKPSETLATIIYKNGDAAAG